MSLGPRLSVAALAFGMLLALPGCGLRSQADGTGAARPEPPAGLAAVDPCALLSDDELTAGGAWLPGRPDDMISAEPGCDYDGSPFFYSFSKNQEKTVESYGAQDTWAKFERRELLGRAAANTITKISVDGRICSTMFDAGGGVIIVTAGELNEQGRDECAESWRLAELIAPRMPH